MNRKAEVQSPLQLQLALDMVSLDKAIEVCQRARPHIDRIEIGTPLLLSAGFLAVRRLRQLYPDAVIVADTKICDAGERIARAAFYVGADVVTVVAPIADRVTWEGVRRACEQAGEGHRVMADLIGSRDMTEEAYRSAELGAHELCVHLPKRSQAGGMTIREAFDLAGAISRISGRAVYVAGGLEAGDLSDARDSGVTGLIVGGAITGAEDPREAAKAFRLA